MWFGVQDEEQELLCSRALVTDGNRYFQFFTQQYFPGTFTLSHPPIIPLTECKGFKKACLQDVKWWGALHSSKSTSFRRLTFIYNSYLSVPLIERTIQSIYSIKRLKQLPEQKGMGALHIPLSWHVRDVSPFSCLPPRQEYRTVEPNVNLSPLSTPFGGEPGWPQSTTRYQERWRWDKWRRDRSFWLSFLTGAPSDCCQKW